MNGKVILSNIDASKRTEEDFRRTSDPMQHVEETSLTQLFNFQLVS